MSPRKTKMPTVVSMANFLIGRLLLETIYTADFSLTCFGRFDNRFHIHKWLALCEADQYGKFGAGILRPLFSVTIDDVMDTIFCKICDEIFHDIFCFLEIGVRQHGHELIGAVTRRKATDRSELFADKGAQALNRF